MDRQIAWQLRRARSAGSPRLLGQSTPVAPVLEDLMLVLRREAEARGITVRIDCPSAIRFAGERQDLEEMLGNLLENAVKYASSRIDVTAANGKDRLSVSIEDDGPGMEATDHALALSRGGRLDEMGPPGTGLGLAIVADLAALHGGKLSLGRGSLGGLRAGLTLPG